MTYFSSITNLEDLKKSYKKLAFENHPDKGGDTATMQEIIVAYKQAVKRIQGFGSGCNEKGISFDDAFVTVINDILSVDNIVIEICGSWVWVSGDTKPAKDILKGAGFRWATKKKMWYWRSETSVSRGRGYTMDTIRAKYGTQQITSTNFRKKIA